MSDGGIGRDAATDAYDRTMISADLTLAISLAEGLAVSHERPPLTMERLWAAIGVPDCDVRADEAKWECLGLNDTLRLLQFLTAEESAYRNAVMTREQIANVLADAIRSVTVHRLLPLLVEHASDGERERMQATVEWLIDTTRTRNGRGPTHPGDGA